MAQRRILLVEDNADDEFLTLKALRDGGVNNEIVVARDGQEALDLLLGTEEQSGWTPGELPELILLDLKLPKVSGLDVLHSLKAHERTGSIPIVVLTSSSEQEDMLQGYANGANSYVRKPVEFAKFYQVVKDIGHYWLLLNEVPSR